MWARVAWRFAHLGGLLHDRLSRPFIRYKNSKRLTLVTGTNQCQSLWGGAKRFKLALVGLQSLKVYNADTPLLISVKL